MPQQRSRLDINQYRLTYGEPGIPREAVSVSSKNDKGVTTQYMLRKNSYINLFYLTELFVLGSLSAVFKESLVV